MEENVFYCGRGTQEEMNTEQVGKAPLGSLGEVCMTDPGLHQPPWVHAFWAPSCSLVIYCAICKLIFSLLGPQKSFCIPKHICTLKTNTFSLVAAGVCEQAQA